MSFSSLKGEQSAACLPVSDLIAQRKEINSVSILILIKVKIISTV
jgi:hypothetical protein